MKRLILPLLVLCFPLSLGAQANVNFFLDLCRFQDIRSGSPYIEAYIAVVGNSLVFREEADGKFQVKVNVDLLLQRLEGGDTLDLVSRNYNLTLADQMRPADTTLASRSRANPFYMHTIPLPGAGTYLLQVMATDSIAPYSSKRLAIQEFIVDSLTASQFAFSDIKWVAGELPRQGDDGRKFASRDELIPMVSNSTFFNEDSLVFYQEIYHADQILEENFLIRCVIYQGDNRLWQTETRGQPRSPRAVNIYKEAIRISELSSNTYYLQVELVNRKNRPVQTFRQKFYVFNSRKDPEFEFLSSAGNPESDIFNEYTETQLDYYLRTLIFNATEQEQGFLQVLETYEQKKNFLYSYFAKRKRPDQQVQDLWRGHLAAVRYANQEFKSAFREGWQTDRGRAFLKYGIPNDVERFPSEPNLVPYEIWRYNRLDVQNNIVFIFYDPDLATNEYPLLHSNKYGEFNNPRWKSQLTTSNMGNTPGEIDFEANPLEGRYRPNLEIDD